MILLNCYLKNLKILKTYYGLLTFSSYGSSPVSLKANDLEID